MITAGPLDRDLLASVDDVDTEGRGCLHDGRAFRGRAQTMARRRFRLRVGIFWLGWRRRVRPRVGIVRAREFGQRNGGPPRCACRTQRGQPG